MSKLSCSVPWFVVTMIQVIYFEIPTVAYVWKVYYNLRQMWKSSIKPKSKVNAICYKTSSLMSKLSCSVPWFVIGNVHVYILHKCWGSLFEKCITNCGFITNCVVTCAAICNKLVQQFVINKVITNCGVITNCVVSCAAICNKQVYYKLRRYYKLRGDKA